MAAGIYSSSNISAFISFGKCPALKSVSLSTILFLIFLNHLKPTFDSLNEHTGLYTNVLKLILSSKLLSQFAGNFLS